MATKTSRKPNTQETSAPEKMGPPTPGRYSDLVKHASVLLGDRLRELKSVRDSLAEVLSESPLDASDRIGSRLDRLAEAEGAVRAWARVLKLALPDWNAGRSGTGAEWLARLSRLFLVEAAETGQHRIEQNSNHVTSALSVPRCKAAIQTYTVASSLTEEVLGNANGFVDDSGCIPLARAEKAEAVLAVAEGRASLVWF